MNALFKVITDFKFPWPSANILFHISASSSAHVFNGFNAGLGSLSSAFVDLDQKLVL